MVKTFAIVAVGAFSLLGGATSATAAPSSGLTGPVIVANQSNLALTVSPKQSAPVTLAGVNPPAGWYNGGTNFTSLATCKARGQDLIELGVASNYRCYYNSATGRYELWYSRACIDRVALSQEQFDRIAASESNGSL